MPAVITHHIFGEDASRLLPSELLSNEEDLLAFLLGNQGPDPLWARFRTLPHRSIACHALATSMHEGKVVDTFFALRDATTRMLERDNHIARAFVLGLACHYLLDSIVHPLIYAQQYALCKANEALANAGAEVHALLESDLDSWMLWQKRQKTVLESPASSALTSTEKIDRIAGALIAQAGWEVHDIEVGATEYGRAVDDYRLMYRLIDPPAGRMPKVLAHVERFVRPHSRLAAQAHRIIVDDECPTANLDHRQWRNPQTNEVSMASIPDLFHDALMAWPMFSQRFVEGDRDWLERAIANVNYNGVVTD